MNTPAAQRPFRPGQVRRKLLLLFLLACWLRGPTTARADEPAPSTSTSAPHAVRKVVVKYTPWRLPFHLTLAHPLLTARTDPGWLQSYLGLQKLPQTLDTAELVQLQARLLGLPVLSRAELAFVETQDEQGAEDLEITLTEKWAFLPIIRPTVAQSATLWALGGFDGHFLGRLWTLGAQAYFYVPSVPTAERSGTPGGVVWARAPRWLGGDYALLLKLGREVRSRPLYQGTSLEPAGYIRPDLLELDAEVLAPMPFHATKTGSFNTWKVGVELLARAGKPETLLWNAGALEVPPEGITLHEQPWRGAAIFPVLSHDALVPDESGLQVRGQRLVARAGPVLEAGAVRMYLGLEGFSFWRPRPRVNLALHGVARLSGSDRFTGMTFLSELESVRGLPDGYLYGRHALYGNLEARLLAHQGRILSVQGIVFTDLGAAAATLDTLPGAVTVAVGAGVRLASPRIYRMTVRLDVGWNPVQPTGLTRGFSLTPFIDPYRHF